MQLTEFVISDRRRARGRPSGRAPSLRTLAASAALSCLLILHLAWAPSARAQGSRQVLVIPLESSVPDAQADVALAFNLALAELAKQQGASVTVAQTSLDDTMAIVGCSERTASCLGRVADALDVDRIVFGRVDPGEDAGSFEVVLVVARRSGEVPPVAHRFSVRAAAVAEAERAFGEAAPPGFLDAEAEAPVAGEEVAAAASSAPEGESSAPGISYTFEGDRVERSSWIVTGAGGALFGMGTMFWILASSSQSDVDSLEVRSVEDIERLVELEDRTRSRATMGNVLVTTGLLTAAIGAALALRQGLVRQEPAAGVAIEPMATGDAVGLTLVIGWSP